MKELIKVSEQAADAQIKAYFDYYSEEFEEMEEYQKSKGGNGFPMLIARMKRLIRKGILSIEIRETGVVIVQQVFHNKGFSKLEYGSLNGKVALAVSELDGLTEQNTFLGILSGVGEEEIGSLHGQDHKTAQTVYHFLSLL
jgi:hypothetical protein